MPPRSSPRTAFLLSQVGAFASARFAELVAEAGFTPADAGVLRLLGRTSGLSQRVLAERLGAAPSRVVALIDSLEKRGLVRRVRSNTDRRNYELQLTEEGETGVRTLRAVAEAHQVTVLAPLSAEDSAELARILGVLADAHGVDRDLHSGTSGN